VCGQHNSAFPRESSGAGREKVHAVTAFPVVEFPALLIDHLLKVLARTGQILIAARGHHTALIDIVNHIATADGVKTVRNDDNCQFM
jgi:hypothetical protein